MKLRLICVGTRMPAWVEAGVEEYRRRLPREFDLHLVEVPLAQRGKTLDAATARQRESDACLRQVHKGDYLVALDVRGRAFGTEALASELGSLRDDGRDLALVVGGPDGLSPELLSQAQARWSLSALTFPHPIVRIILAEQLYRVWTLLQGHPYHRA